MSRSVGVILWVMVLGCWATAPGTPFKADLSGLGELSRHWQQSNCGAEDFCGGTDLNRDGQTNLADLVILSGAWLNDLTVSFEWSFAAGYVHSLPATADRVRITLQGPVSSTREISRSVLPEPAGRIDVPFWVTPGQYTYTAQIFQGPAILATISPIQITVVRGFPLSIPLVPSFDRFDQYQTDIGGSEPNTQIFFGTEGHGRSVQYGGNADDTQFVESGAGNDWIEQYAGGGNDRQLAESGTENDYILQDGGPGNDIIKIQAGGGNDSCVQIGGPGDDTIEAIGGDGNDTIRIEGGDGNDSIYANPGTGTDSTSIDAGADNDAIIYEVNPDPDIAFIDGGEGADALTIKQNGNPIRIENGDGQVIFQTGTGGTVITATNIEHITALDTNAQTIFQQDIGLTDEPNTQIVFGTPFADTFIQYGGNMADLLSIDCGAGDDRLEQYGGDGDDTMLAESGTGKDTIIQDGGHGNDSMVANPGNSNDQVTQIGGLGDDSLNSLGGEDNDTIRQEGGEGNDSLRCSPGWGDDSVTMLAGEGNDSLIYDLCPGLDTAYLDGGSGYDTLTVNEDYTWSVPYQLRDAGGNMIFSKGAGGTVITVIHVEHVTVLDKNGNIVFQN
jgi:Ca2+-binding RTX toxin-like protein